MADFPIEEGFEWELLDPLRLPVRRVLILRYPGKRVVEFSFVEQGHIPVGLQSPSAKHFLIHLMHHGKRIPIDFNGAVFEKLGVDFDEFQKRQKGCIFALILTPLEAGPENDAGTRDGEGGKAAPLWAALA